MIEDPASMNPHLVRRTGAETDGEFVRFESTIHPAPDADPAVELPHERWGIDFQARHLHPEQTERIEVLSGELQVSLEGDRRTLTEGEEVTIPPDTTHRHWNTAARPVRVVWERRPPFRTEEWAESVYALAQAGKADEEGTPGWLQLAVLVDEYPNASAYLASVPVGVQRVVFSALAPLGRLLGYRATYSREEGDA